MASILPLGDIVLKSDPLIGFSPNNVRPSMIFGFHKSGDSSDLTPTQIKTMDFALAGSMNITLQPHGVISKLTVMQSILLRLMTSLRCKVILDWSMMFHLFLRQETSKNVVLLTNLNQLGQVCHSQTELRSMLHPDISTADDDARAASLAPLPTRHCDAIPLLVFS